MKSINFTYDCDKQMFFGPLQMAAQLDEKTAQEKMVSPSCFFLLSVVFLLRLFQFDIKLNPPRIWGVICNPLGDHPW